MSPLKFGGDLCYSMYCACTNHTISYINTRGSGRGPSFTFSLIFLAIFSILETFCPIVLILHILPLHLYPLKKGSEGS